MSEAKFEQHTPSMLEETGVVVAIEGNFAVIETRRQSACGHCNVGDSCGTSVLSSLFSKKRMQVRLENHLGVAVGDSVVLGVNENVLLSTAVLAYLLPLISMIALTILATQLVGSEISFAFGLAGLFAGMAASNRIMANRIMHGKEFQGREIVLLRNESNS